MPSKYFRFGKHDKYKEAILSKQKLLIEKHFLFFKCKIEKNVLICHGKLKLSEWKNSYSFELSCTAGNEPSTKIIEPSWIIPSREIHMYNNHTLCLHYPTDLKWTIHTEIYKYTIPWLIEWIFYYEKFLINGGNWEGPESPEHFTEADKNISDDIIDY